MNELQQVRPVKYTLVQDETTGSAATWQCRYRLPGSAYLAETEAEPRAEADAEAPRLQRRRGRQKRRRKTSHAAGTGGDQTASPLSARWDLQRFLPRTTCRVANARQWPECAPRFPFSDQYRITFQ